MAEMSLSVPARRDWLLANPWVWLIAGLGLVIWSWAWTAILRPYASDLRILLLIFGLFLASIGSWLRFHDRETTYLYRWLAALALLLRFALAGLFTAAAIGATAILVMAFMNRPLVVMHPPPAIVAWLTVFPLAAGAAIRCLKRRKAQEGLDADEERGLALCVLAGCCMLGTLTLFGDPDDPLAWDSMRLVLRAFTAVCLIGAGLVLVGTALRRLVLSALFVMHFCGISSACLSAPPAPAIVQQTWMRLFRPYLEFMYLNNAYHFYAPDPGPSSYLWFRVIFAADDGGDDFGLWYKVPHTDANGKIHHPVSLEYQRYLSMTESIAQTDPLPSELIFDPDLRIYKPNPMYAIRLQLGEGGPVMIGDLKSPHPRIPLHPQILKVQQVNIPGDGPRRLLASFARHLANKFPTYKDEDGRPGTFKSVKIYRVIHAIPPVAWFQPQKQMDQPGQQSFFLSATDPTQYRPYFVGNYNAEGKRLNEVTDRDPYLFWLLPILREHPNDPRSAIKDHCRRHAGDANWIRDVDNFFKD